MLYRLGSRERQKLESCGSDTSPSRGYRRCNIGNNLWLGEVVVGFTGNYLNILSTTIAPANSTVVIGAFYILGSVSLFVTRRKWGAVLSILFIGAEILGRVYLVMIAIAPASGPDAIKILIGGVIAFALILYIGFKWKSFQ
jgi:hypothetical protein